MIKINTAFDVLLAAEFFNFCFHPVPITVFRKINVLISFRFFRHQLRRIYLHICKLTSRSPVILRRMPKDPVISRVVTGFFTPFRMTRIFLRITIKTAVHASHLWIYHINSLRQIRLGDYGRSADFGDFEHDFLLF